MIFKLSIFTSQVFYFYHNIFNEIQISTISWPVYLGQPGSLHAQPLLLLLPAPLLPPDLLTQPLLLLLPAPLLPPHLLSQPSHSGGQYLCHSSRQLLYLTSF